MKERLLLVLVATLAISAFSSTPSHAQGFWRWHWPPKPPARVVPELNPKLLIGGLALTIAGAALLLENRRRRNAAASLKN